MNRVLRKIRDGLPPPRVLWLSVAGAILVSALYLFQVRQIHGQAGFPLDDSWIHVRIAENLAGGHGFSFNKGVPAPVSTEPLWTLLLAIPFFFFRDPFVSAHLLGLALVVLTCWYAYKLALLVTRDEKVSVLAAVIPVFTPSFTWGSLSGMGVPLFVLLTFMGAYYHMRYRWRDGISQFIPTLVLGLAALARPECFLLFGFACAHYIGHSLFLDRRPPRSVAANVAIHVMVFALVTSPFFAFNLATSGRFFPNTYYAKNIFWFKLNEGKAIGGWTGSVASWISYSVHLFVEFGRSTGWIAAVLIPFGCARLYLKVATSAPQERMRPGLILLFAFAHPLVLSAQNARIFGGTHVYGAQARYFSNVFLLWAFLGALGVGFPVKGSARWRRYLKVALVTLLLAVMGWKQWQNSRVYAANVKNVDEMNVAAAKWVDRHAPREARIAVNDVGAIAYFSGREIIDILGLVNPDAWPYLRNGQRGIFDYIKKTRPDYLVVFPKWFPLVVSQKEYFQPVHSVSIEDNTIVGSDLMVIYRCAFPPETPPEDRNRAGASR